MAVNISNSDTVSCRTDAAHQINEKKGVDLQFMCNELHSHKDLECIKSCFAWDNVSRKCSSKLIVIWAWLMGLVQSSSDIPYPDTCGIFAVLWYATLLSMKSVMPLYSVMGIHSKIQGHGSIGLNASLTPSPSCQRIFRPMDHQISESHNDTVVENW